MDSAKALCKVHEDRIATSNCERCGDFACDDCLRPLLDKSVCENCATQGGLGNLDRFRLQTSGVRDGFVWSFGITGILVLLPWLIMTASFFDNGGLEFSDLIFWVLTVLAWFIFILHLSYLSLKPWARKSLFGGPILGVLALLVLGSLNELSLGWLGGVGVYGVIHSALVLLATRSFRNKLAFGLELDEPSLRSVFLGYKENRAAPLSLVVALGSVVFPPLLLVSLILGGVALGRCGPEAWPVVKGRSYAYLGLTFSMLGMMFWAFILSLGL